MYDDSLFQRHFFLFCLKLNLKMAMKCIGRKV